MDRVACKRCGYPRRKDASVCPECGAGRLTGLAYALIAGTLIVGLTGLGLFAWHAVTLGVFIVNSSPHDAQPGPPPPLNPHAILSKGIRDDDWLAGLWDNEEAGMFAVEANRLLCEDGNVGEALFITNWLLDRADPFTDHRLSDDDFRKVAVIVSGHVRAYFATGADKTAVHLAERLRKIAWERSGENPVYGVCLGNLGELARSQGDWLASEKLLSKAAEILRKDDKYKTSLLPILVSQGQLYCTMGEPAKAAGVLEEALGLVRQKRERRAEHIAALNTLAGIAVELGRIQDAERLLLEAREIKAEKVFQNTSYWRLRNVGLDFLRVDVSEGDLRERFREQFGEAPAGEPGVEPWNSGSRARSLPASSWHTPPGYRGLGSHPLPGIPGQSPPSSHLDPKPGPSGRPNSTPLQLDAIRARIAQREYHAIAEMLRGGAWADRVYGPVRGRRPDNWMPSVEYLINSIQTETELGSLCAKEGDFAKARQHLQQVADRVRTKLGKDSPEYVGALNHFGRLHTETGDLDEAARCLNEANERCRGSHPLQATTLFNLALLRQAQGNHAEAARLMEDVLQHELRWVREVVPFLSEAEGLNFLAANLRVRDPLLSALDDVGEKDSHRAYLAVWRTRALATRTLMEIRRLAQRRPEAQTVQAELRLKRRQLAELALAEATLRDGDERRKALAELTAEKERLERQLRESGAPKETGKRDAAAQPAAGIREAQRRMLDRLDAAIRDQQSLEDEATRRNEIESLGRFKKRMEEDLARSDRLLEESDRRARGEPAGHAPEAEIDELIAKLPAGAAVVDLIQRNVVSGRKDGKARPGTEPHYDAFVLRSAQHHGKLAGVVRVNFGPCGPIDSAVAAWRALLRQPAGGAKTGADDRTAGSAHAEAPSPGRRVRQLVWERLEPHLAGCDTVIVVPDQELTRVPWPALPGRRPGTYLLEDYRVGIATHAHSLGDLLARPAEAVPGGRLLLVGGVDYDRPPAAAERKSELPDAARRAAISGTRPAVWPPLPGAAAEIESLRRLWTGRGPLTVLSGTDAGKSRVCGELTGSRYVHLATHGFFADSKFRSVFELEPAATPGPGPVNFLEAGGWKSRSVGRRNPLLLSGLALAGANRAPKTDAAGVPEGNRGILTAEEIVDLDLRTNELVVLSACETGLGEVAGGEGVFGLQRAFHLAGARSVVASLWAVDDAATRALMVEFYRNLWEKRLGKLESLRQAQLAMMRQYDPRTRTLRGLSAVPAEPFQPPGAGRPASQPGDPLPPFYWAAFVLSGDWR